MVLVTPRERKHLSADALFRVVRSGFAAIPDYRLSDTEMSLTDALMTAFALFSLKSPSLLKLAFVSFCAHVPSPQSPIIGEIYADITR